MKDKEAKTTKVKQNKKESNSKRKVERETNCSHFGQSGNTANGTGFIPFLRFIVYFSQSVRSLLASFLHFFFSFFSLSVLRIYFFPLIFRLRLLAS